MMFTLAHSVNHELIIKKSRFIACVQAVANREQVHEIVEQLRAAHPSAAHVCWAFMAAGHSAANDDGEPSGTAGRPMLEVLRHQHLDGVLATVVRYFGGIKLGAGGLVRAYTDSVAQALVKAEKVEYRPSVCLTAAFPYALEGQIRYELSKFSATIVQVVHEENVSCAFEVLAMHREECVTRLNDCARGQLIWQTKN